MLWQACCGRKGAILSILSIQSAVAYGHVGNSAAVFPLQRLGFEVWPVNTVMFSNHAGYETCRGPAMAAADISDVVTGLEELGQLKNCRAVLSGYLGVEENGAAIADAVERAKRANPSAVYCCDPVIGDTREGVYVGQGIVDFIRDRLVPMADILTPNRFELEQLTGRKGETDEELAESARSLIDKGVELVAVTSLPVESDRPKIANLIVTREAAWRVTTPRVFLKAKGTGDLFAALLLGHALGGLPAPQALSRTCSVLFRIIEETSKADANELLLIEAQEALRDGSDPFPALSIGR